MLTRHRHLLLLPLLAIAALAYAPGLNGPFLFDDGPNLAGLAAVQRDGTWAAALQYALSGIASTLGRPLALLTFAAQAASWPNAPADFIRVNIALHLLNGLLWYGVLVRLQRLGVLPAARLLPAAACALWLLLPIHGGAVLYVVQRMTVLATTCVLAGMLLYLSGRAAAAARPGAGYVRMSVGVALGTVLGTLAKETAAVMPLLLLALEATLLRGLPRPSAWRAWSAAFLWLPAALLLGWYAYCMPQFLEGYAARSFTAAERLLTQSRVLFAYLAQSFVPRPDGIRLLYDDLALSTGISQPWTTALALAGWTVVLATIAGWRRRRPVLAFAGAWYLIGHALEGSFIPLEIAFDHRTYLPLLAVTLAVAVGWTRLAALDALASVRPFLSGAAAVYLVLVALCLWSSAALWGQPLEQARRWVELQPESRRAVKHYADRLLGQREPAAAAALLGAAQARWPDDAVLALAVYELGCLHPAPGALAGARAAVGAYRGGETYRALSVLDGLAWRYEQAGCPYGRVDDAVGLIDTMLEAPRFHRHAASLHHAAARILDAGGRTAEALARLDRELALQLEVPVLQQAILWSVLLDDVPRARGYLRELEASPRLDARARWLYREEIAGARQLIELYESPPPAPPT